MRFLTENILDYPVAYEPIKRFVDFVTELVDGKSRSCSYFACLNPHSVETASADADFRRALLDADFMTADGVGIIYASKIFGHGLVTERVTGSDMFHELNRVLDASGGASCFFLGSTEQTLAKICSKHQHDYPGIRIAGTYSPPFKPAFDAEDVEEMIRRVNAADCDVLWVGMTAPKQEKWIHEHRGRLKVAFAAPIGAVFDFYAGNVKRSGAVWQRLGLEWLPRLVQEPRRLWRRNFVSSPAFLLRCARHRIRYGKPLRDVEP